MQGKPISTAPRDGTPILVSVMKHYGVPDTGHYRFELVSYRATNGNFLGWHPVAERNMTYGEGAFIAWWPEGTPEAEMDQRPRTNWKYQSSNGTEGMCFQEGWCERCQRDRAFRDDPDNADGCKILADSMAYEIGDAAYPDEMIETEGGEPKCTAFVKIGDEAAALPRCTDTNDLFGGA